MLWPKCGLCCVVYSWGDSDIILSTTVTAAMLEVYYVASVLHRKLYACLQTVVCGIYTRRCTRCVDNLGVPHFNSCRAYLQPGGVLITFVLCPLTSPHLMCSFLAVAQTFNSVYSMFVIFFQLILRLTKFRSFKSTNLAVNAFSECATEAWSSVHMTTRAWLVIQPFQTVIRVVFIWAVGPKPRLNSLSF